MFLTYTEVGITFLFLFPVIFLMSLVFKEIRTLGIMVSIMSFIITFVCGGILLTSHMNHLENEDDIFKNQDSMYVAYDDLKKDYENPFVHEIISPNVIRQIPDNYAIEGIDIIKDTKDGILAHLTVINENYGKYEKKSVDALLTKKSYKDVTNNIYHTNDYMKSFSHHNQNDKITSQHKYMDEDIEQIKKILED